MTALEDLPPLPPSPPAARAAVKSAPTSPRRSSFASSRASTTAQPLISSVLVLSLFDSISASKVASKDRALKDAVDKAVTLLKSPQAATLDAAQKKTVFEPLRLACETRNNALMINALDCVAKLVSYGFFAAHSPYEDDKPVRHDDGLSELVIDTICGCFIDTPGATTNQAAAANPTGPDAVNLQIVKALLALILQEGGNDKTGLSVHQANLLKAVRTVYNIFLLSRSAQNQTIAQGALSQIVGSVFGKIKLNQPIRSVAPTRPTSAAGHPEEGEQEDTESVMVEDGATERESMDTKRESIDTIREGNSQSTDAEGMSNEEPKTAIPEVVLSEAAPASTANGHVNGLPTPTPSPMPGTSAFIMGNDSKADLDEFGPIFSENDLHVKDAFLVLRALCKLSMKALTPENEKDLKSHPMRSKILSLQLILSIISTYLPVFLDPSVLIQSSSTKDQFTPFVQAIKQHLLLSLSRNAVSPVLNVFELSCEIFWRMLSGMRTRFKKEIEVLLNEIFLPILEMKNSSVRQKSILLSIMSRLCADPQALVDIYLNYDCDRMSLDNVYERLTNIIARIGTTQFTTTTGWVPPTSEPMINVATSSGVQPSQSFDSMPNASSHSAAYTTVESHVKRQSLDCLISLLRSLVTWAGKGVPSAAPSENGRPNYNRNDSAVSLPTSSRQSFDNRPATPTIAEVDSTMLRTGSETPRSDDPSRFESAKQRKTTLLEGIRTFNFKPKRGINYLIETGFIKTRSPKDIGRFLLHAEGLNKAMIGEWLGEGDPENVATMHAFVDLMDFANMPFVTALRTFLQSFRLPGEAQKIDRFMLKFAERYIAGNPSTFANADTAYILAFSTIMLNTDAHSPQIKKNRMTKAEFLKNNAGINAGQDLEEKLLSDIYDEIQSNEIRMNDEHEGAPGSAQNQGLAGTLASVGRDLQREAYLLQSEGMANKTEAKFRTIVRAQKGGPKEQDQFFSASHYEHVRPMFEVAWMPILAGISAPLQDSDDIEAVRLALQGFKQAIKIVCLFDLELERNAFVTTLAKFTFLNNLSEMRQKNVEAIKCLFDVAAVDGNYLKNSWKEVLTCVSQLERFQLISRGVDSSAVPQLGRKQSVSSAKSSSKATKQARPTDDVALETLSTNMLNASDRVFSTSNTLSGEAIVDFVKALSEVSWDEIQSSGLTEHPRVFSLQKLVEISYYNMGRIRLEWTHIWAILGEHFNQVCCHTNANVSYLALDSLRQLAMRFLEKEELTNFNFQKDFLKPFEYAMVHNNNPDARDMILQCMQQMLQARVENLRSGWRTMFGVFSAASKVLTERIASQAFEVVKHLNKDHFDRIVSYGSFADLAVCITDFCKISKYQKISLHAIEMLRGLIAQMLKCPECPLSDLSDETEKTVDDAMIKFWFPVLFGFYDIIMNGEDLEVRKRALDYLFSTLKTHGDTFTSTFWDSIASEVLFPIFSVLRSRSDISRASTHEDMSVWLSTTMIQALRDLVDLFSVFFHALEGRMLDQLLDLLTECICQENDTLARIGTACLQQLIEKNVHKLSPQLWERIMSTFVRLFETTAASQLFDDNLRAPLDSDMPETPATPRPDNGLSFAPLVPTDSTRSSFEQTTSSAPMKASARRRIFRQIIVKCVLQLLLIETAHDLLDNEEVYSTIPPAELLRLMKVIDESYRLARKFNEDKELRMDLWKVGFMKQLPNLLKQESNSASTLVSVLLRMYSDPREDHVSKRDETVAAFLPLGIDIMEGFSKLDEESQARNIAAWKPVVVEVLLGCASFEDETLKTHSSTLYPLTVDLLSRDVAPELRESIRNLLARFGSVYGMYSADPPLAAADE